MNTVPPDSHESFPAVVPVIDWAGLKEQVAKMDPEARQLFFERALNDIGIVIIRLQVECGALEFNAQAFSNKQSDPPWYAMIAVQVANEEKTALEMWAREYCGGPNDSVLDATELDEL